MKLGVTCLMRSLAFAILFPLLATFAVGQRVAVFAPDGSEVGKEFAQLIAEAAAARSRIIDASIAESAFQSVSPATPFNLTTSDAKRIGAAIGSDAFVLVRAATQRRSASGRSDYFESYAAVFCVSSRTGELFMWRLESYEADSAVRSRQMLDSSAVALADEIRDSALKTIKNDLSQAPLPAFEEPPDERSTNAKGFRPPVPYRRIKPEYTSQAALYDVAATVDLSVYLDSSGKIVRTEVDRWAGFGLDEAVENNVRSMNWRPAERDGKPLATKFLVRYNFKKIEKPSE